MATTANTAGAGNQVVGKVFILYGTVKAVSPDGTVRVLAPNSPIFANEQIITGNDGSISIQFDGPPVTQLDLGRMTEIVIDEDVYAGVAPEVVTEAAADAEKIQEALLAGDEEIDLEATAAGGTADGGGGHPTVVFDLDGNEVNPVSGAETEGIITSSVDPLSGVVPEGTAPPAPEPTFEPTPEPEPVILPPPGPAPLFAAVVAAPIVEIPVIPEIPDGPEPEPVTGKVTLSATVEEPAPPIHLDHGISHVLYIVDIKVSDTVIDTVAVKLEDYAAGEDVKDVKDPAGYENWIEQQTLNEWLEDQSDGSSYEGYYADVKAYYIKTGTGQDDPAFYNQDGENILADDGKSFIEGYEFLMDYVNVKGGGPDEGAINAFNGDETLYSNDPDDYDFPVDDPDEYTITLTATVDNAPTGALTLTITDNYGNPYEITIKGGETSGFVEIVLEDGVYLDYTAGDADEVEGVGYLQYSITDTSDPVDAGYDDLNTDSTVLIGGEGDDTLTGGEGDDFILGGEGDDTIDGGEGNDTIYGGEGDDTIDGGEGDDTIDGGDGNDTIDGGEGDDTIYGGDGNDTIDGGAGEDTIFGGAGADKIEAKDGEADTIGKGASDTISYDDTPPLDTLVSDPDDPVTT